MAMTTLGNPASVADRLQNYFSKKLLAVQTDELVLNQFGTKATLPRNSKDKTMKFFKPAKADVNLKKAPNTDNSTLSGGLPGADSASSSVVPLSEGVPPTNYRENVFTNVSVTLVQLGEITKLSDVVRLIDAYEPLEQNIELMGRDAALSADTLTRNVIIKALDDSDEVGGPEVFRVTGGVYSNLDVGTSTGSEEAFAELLALAQSAGKITRAGILHCVTTLKRNNAPKYRNGRYVCLVPPEISHDLMQEESYEKAFTGVPQGIWKGMLGSLDGCDFVDHTNPFIEDDTYGTYDAADAGTAGLIYSTMFIGQGAFGVPKLDGTNSPWAPKVIINNKPDKADPLNQFCVAGWKAFYNAVLLDDDNLVVLRTKSTFA